MPGPLPTRRGRPPTKSLLGESTTTVLTMSRAVRSMVGSALVGPSIIATSGS